MRTAVLGLVGLVSSGLFAVAADSAVGNWPQWRGPLATGAAPEGQPPTSWAEDRNVQWKVEVPGFGNSTPVIWGNRIYLATAITESKAPAAGAAAAERPPGGGNSAVQEQPPTGGNAAPAGAAGENQGRRRRGGPGGFGGGGPGGFRNEPPSGKTKFALLALDRATGKIVWQKTAREEVPHEGHHRDGSFASASPITDGEHVFVSFGSRGIYCYDLEGNLKWEKDLGDMQTRNAFGEGASPAVHGDTIVLNWDHEGEDFVVALDKKTGAEKWRQKRDEPTSWSTPLVVEHAGKLQVVVSATNRVRSYDLATGAQVWEASGMTGNVIPTPVSAFGMVYPISGFRGAALLAIKLGATGVVDGTDAIAWKHGKSTPYVSSPLLVGERLYFFSGNNALLSCFNAKTGKPYFEAHRLNELGGDVYASPVAAGGHVYIVGRYGKAVVLKDSDQPEVVSVNVLNDRVDASPAIAGDEIYIRGHQHLYRIGAK
jgi:outer membrane protein assembly factor BamB